MTSHEHTLLEIITILQDKIKVLEAENKALSDSIYKSGVHIPNIIWDANIDMSNTDFRSPSFDTKVHMLIQMIRSFLSNRGNVEW